jgi:DNA adenine methylase
MKRVTSASAKRATEGARAGRLPTTLSPFRYPGGKSWLRPFVLDWLDLLPSRPSVFVEPFAGGASVGLAVAELGLADEVHLIERDKDVAAVWKATLGGNCPQLCERIKAFRMSRNAVVAALADERDDLVSVAFRCLLRNRVQRGGILAPRAGLLRKGERGNGVSSRWYPVTLMNRLRTIHSLAERIRFTEGDAMLLLPVMLRRTDAAVFVDPPYVVNGNGPGIRLYRHTQVDHECLFAMLSEARSACLATYHPSPEIRRLARLSGFSISSRAMRTTHHSQRRELILRRIPGDGAAGRTSGFLARNTA